MEQREASASVDPAGGIRVHMVLELRKQNGAMVPASEKARKGTQYLGLLSL
jgi:hypothetical protein